MTYKSLAYRLANLEIKKRVSLPALVIFYRESEGLSLAQEQRIADAKQCGRPVRIIRTFVAGNG